MDWGDLSQATGQVIDGRYRLEEPLGRGICRAFCVQDRTNVRFHRLERAHLRFDPEQPPPPPHPWVAPMLAGGVLDDRWAWVVCPQPDGPSLDDLLEEGALPLDQALRVLQNLGAVARALHERGQLWLDLRPRDVFLATAWQGDDSIICPAHPDLLGPAAGRRVGGYCAPEVVRLYGKDPDARADQFCLGVIGFELLTGTTPHNPDAPPGDRTQMPIFPHPRIPERLEKLLQRLLDPSPSARFDDDETWIRQLASIAHDLEPSGAYGQFTPAILPKRMQRIDPATLPPIVEDPESSGSWDENLALLVLLLIVFVTALATSTFAVLAFW